MNRGFLFFLVSSIIGGLIVIGLTLMILGDNVKNADAGFHELYIPSNFNYDSVIAQLELEGILRNPRTFDWVAERMNYPNTIEPGKFLIPNAMSNRSLVRQLRQGFNEQSVKLSLSAIDSRRELYEKVSSVLECDTQSLRRVFQSDSIIYKYALTIENAWGMVLSDTYQFHWDTDAVEFFGRMHREFESFWTPERRARCSRIGLSPMDCIILASIIEKESAMPEEYARIAGVYVNRLKKDWPLQADPTVKYALGQPGLKRILNQHLEFDSPYNTYRYKGLPPGPISLPEKTTINAVLGAEEHDYMYFCANADFSGYHVFSKTLREHTANARKYQAALNRNGIF